jgi:hypothetical protein
MATDGKLEWSETAGLKQLVRTEKMSDEDALQLIDIDYQIEHEGKVA